MSEDKENPVMMRGKLVQSPAKKWWIIKEQGRQREQDRSELDFGSRLNRAGRIECTWAFTWYTVIPRVLQLHYDVWLVILAFSRWEVRHTDCP